MRSHEDIIRDLQRMVTVDHHRCFGCGREHSCGIHGCAIIREGLALIASLQASLSASEEARSDLGRLLAKTQQSLHETKSEFEAAVRGQRTLQEALAKALQEKKLLLKDLAGCIDCCDACAYSADANPKCSLECDSCRLACHCKTCRDGSNFVWRGIVHGEG